ncbi:hypothetical protein [Streptomyces sp. NPDC007991]|uniref:hypothetical protein n=1 Tax=Streptomyces sp. NPDC007991 TaxID=3364803 RepID=UPI0036E70A41
MADERLVRFDRVLGVDRGVAHRRVDVAVTCNYLRNVKRQLVEDGIGDEDSPKVMGLEREGVSAASVSPDAASVSLSPSRIVWSEILRSSPLMFHW